MEPSADSSARLLRRCLADRFGETVPVADDQPGLDALARMAGRRSHRRFADIPVGDDTVRLLCAVALSSPSKSDLQQRDIIDIRDPALRDRLVTFAGGEGWMRAAPVFLVVCGNNRRQRQIHEWQGRPFANDHLDAFFNAAVDAAIALAAFVTAAEAVGLGCCPISAIRNHAAEVSDLLRLPDHVFPVAGLVLGYPAEAELGVNMRLPLDITVHRDRFGETEVRTTVSAYDQARRSVQPYGKQRMADRYGEAPDYGWLEDKARQYSRPERETFGDFIRQKGFDLR